MTDESSEIQELSSKPSIGKKIIGAVCILFSVLLLLVSIPQLIGALAHYSNAPDPAKMQGYIFSSSIFVFLGGWLLRYGYRKF